MINLCGLVCYTLKPKYLNDQIDHTPTQDQSTIGIDQINKIDAVDNDIDKQGTDVARIIFTGLENLAYRGYDSAGVAVLSDNSDDPKIALQKTAGKISRLEPLLDFLPNNIICGIGHTRWATHGPSTKINAHPHLNKGIALVHNGVIENHQHLKEHLQKHHITIVSATDTEIALRTLNYIISKNNNIEQALIKLYHQLEGHFTMGMITESRPGRNIFNQTWITDDHRIWKIWTFCRFRFNGFFQ